MKKRFDLQMFADDAAGAGTEGTTGSEGTQEGTNAEGAQAEPEKKYSDADVDKIIKDRFARWQKDQEKAVADAKAEAEKLAKMNAEQKRQYEAEQAQKKQQEAMDKLMKENEELKRAALTAELGKTAANLLAEKGIEASESVLGFVVGEDADKTKANIDAFVKVVEAQVKKAEIARATGTTPRIIQHDGNTMSEVDKRIAKYQ